MSHTGVYEIIPGFAAGFIAAYAVSLISPKPSNDVEQLFEKAVAMTDE